MASVNRNKGNLKYFFPDEYVVLDIETTGLSNQFDNIIEIGAVKIKNDTELESFSTLVNPSYPTPFELSPFISDLTGITSSMIASKGLSMHNALESFLSFIGDSILVAHNASFDINFLYDAIYSEFNLEFHNDYVDTMQIAKRHAFLDMDHHRVSDFVDLFDLNFYPGFTQAHRALNDAWIEKQIFDLEKNKLGGNWVKKQNVRKQTSVIIDIPKPNLNTDQKTILFEKNVCITGKFKEFNRSELVELIASLGAKFQPGIRVNTNILLIGDDKGPRSSTSKQKSAERFNENGKANISLLTESELLKILSF